MKIPKPLILVVATFPLISFADFSGEIFAPEIRETKKKGESVYTFTARVVVKSPAEGSAVPKVRVAALIDFKHKTKSRTFLSTTWQTRDGYVVAHSAAEVKNAGKAGSTLVEAQIAPSWDKIQLMGETLGRTDSIAAFHVELLYKDQVLHSRIIENEPKVKHLQQEHHLPDQWWIPRTNVVDRAAN